MVFYYIRMITFNFCVCVLILLETAIVFAVPYRQAPLLISTAARWKLGWVAP